MFTDTNHVCGRLTTTTDASTRSSVHGHGYVHYYATLDGPTMPQTHCQLTREITHDNQLGMEGCWTLRGCDTISGEYSYELSPSTDLDQLFMDHRENLGGRAVQRSIHAIALVPQAENVGSKHVGLYHLGRKQGKQVWLPIQARALTPSTRSPLSDAQKLSNMVQPIVATPTATAEKCVCQFQDMYVRDRRQTTKHRAYQQYLHITIEMYADVRADGSGAPEWIKVAQRRSNPIVMFGKVGGKTEFPTRPHRCRQTIRRVKV
jgi:hypothetical protein